MNIIAEYDADADAVRISVEAGDTYASGTFTVGEAALIIERLQLAMEQVGRDAARRN